MVNYAKAIKEVRLLIQRFRGWIKAVKGELRGKSKEEAEDTSDSFTNLAPTKRYEIVNPKGDQLQRKGCLRTDSGVVFLQHGFLVGRGTSCHLKLTDPKASRVHASFTQVPGGWLLQDNASKNGTFVNGRKIHQTLLRSGDTIQIGQTVLNYEER
mgnify:CR=1 FL=1